ncbi:hypothetical protein V2I01_00235 [Micromonospora sp. BRA006-A]|nr:hypothetical protein [Micromonospora sp. BRA006-A]
MVRDFDYKGWDNLATFWTGWGAQAWARTAAAAGSTARRWSRR